MAVLGSGSGGNATLIQAGETTLLVDAGLSAKQLRLRMEMMGVTREQLTGVLLTHEHSDHSKGIKVLLKDIDVPVYANALTKEFLKDKYEGLKWRVFQNGADFELGDFSVRAFPVPHDAQEPVGFRLESDYGRVGVLTDIGYVTGVVRNSLSGLDGLFLEANYDAKLLEDDLKRPWSIKQRISSRHGHLSNEQAAELLADISCESLQSIIIGHLSSDCNTEKHVLAAFSGALEQKQVALPANFVCATQDKPTEWIEFGTQKLPSVASCEEGGQGQLF